jgi:hypothetical protein
MLLQEVSESTPQVPPSAAAIATHTLSSGPLRRGVNSLENFASAVLVLSHKMAFLHIWLTAEMLGS